MLQRVRDEAHRFAITFQRSKRRITASALDTVEGLGAAKRQALLDHFGSVTKIKRASADELTQVKGIGPALVERIVAAFRKD